MYPLITLEEHYLSNDVRKLREGSSSNPYNRFPPITTTQLLDLSDLRLKDMDAGSVSLQIVSHGPGNFPPELCHAGNDHLSAAIQQHPTRLAGWAMLPMSQPTQAADELTRCVQQLGFRGALIDNHLDGRFYDDASYWPVFARAHDLDVPLYLHPTFAPAALQPHYSGNFSDAAAFWMGHASWGWHSETALHLLRLWAAGVFDRFPRLKLVVGHMGEMLPFQLDRICGQARAWGTELRRDLRTVWEENVWVTTSGMFSLAPLACLLRVSPIEKIMYSVDYPFSTNEKGAAFVEEMDKSGLLTTKQMEMICYKNAENLLGVNAPKS
ncbi:putative 2-amino-3-carboxymuconate-6-semialdehyde decarboxylase [Viridothelium virens]|uniref:Putative 2-amino-3-carboxymuconate-6-semialdehyde decarboxylase n=1 Tax=Viridothelium virens TaxID=1048519 RepID=A0A6A6H9S7_VIRVR|nr:putative 2-amino-3-carboxymuconate-6-semialdehyde decarboxylase [Viridothelium virens]